VCPLRIRIGLAINALSLLAHDASARVDMSSIVSLMTD
jgi:hypothetical protein